MFTPLLARCLAPILGAAFLGIPALPAAEPIVLDNPQAQAGPAWMTTAYSKDKLGADYFHTPTWVDPSHYEPVIYRPNLATAGLYDIEILYPQGANRSTNAAWTIVSRDGKLPVFVNQQINGGQWFRIASGVTFDAGTNGCVEVSNINTHKGTVVVADGVRFVPCDQSAPAAAPTAVLAGCTLQIKTDGRGTITLSPHQPVYPSNATVTLTAKAYPGHVFAGWTGAGTNRFLNPFTLTLRSNKNVACAFLPRAEGVIMDNTEAVFKGSWLPSKEAWPGTRYENYFYTSSATDKVTASATYHPQITKPGKYDVYLWYPSGDNRSPHTPVIVAGLGDKIAVEVNQQINGGKWVLVANACPFAEGSTGFVRINNATGKNGETVIADAVALVQVSP